MTTFTPFADQWGPVKMVYIHVPSAKLDAVVAIDNVACGPAIGGVRMAPDVSAEEAFRLARAMTFKNAAAGLPHGGGKSVILGEPLMPAGEKEKLLRAFASAIRGLTEYIPGPDMGTDERCMAWIWDEIGRAVGLPAELGGIPLDALGATGFGLSVCAEVAQNFCDLNLKGARVAIQGFGNVGKHAARFLTQKGALLVAAADICGTLVDASGIDVERLIHLKNSGQCVTDYPKGEKQTKEAIIDMECDIWVPAARPDVIHMDNVDRLKAKMVLSGANIPITLEAEEALHKKGILVVPDFIANAGGVICAAAEYRGETETMAFQEIEEKIRHNTELVLEESARTGALPRQSALNLARQRLDVARVCRRWS